MTSAAQRQTLFRRPAKTVSTSTEFHTHRLFKSRKLFLNYCCAHICYLKKTWKYKFYEREEPHYPALWGITSGPHSSKFCTQLQINTLEHDMKRFICNKTLFLLNTLKLHSVPVTQRPDWKNMPVPLTGWAAWQSPPPSPPPAVGPTPRITARTARLWAGLSVILAPKI